ncbi:uncharacterized protein [Aegilops tauschii subsp. strangulata]|uniref:uncharacterized protein n=1 Tax=Aegilops tauschii subsp. strangulata TaxID=200361 RepID=UPI003CC8CB52
MEADFFRDFRMHHRTFKSLCEELAGAAGKMDAAGTIPLEKCVAVCLWLLAMAQPFRTVSDKFNLPVATCNRLFHDGCATSKAVHFCQELTNAAAMYANAARFQDVSGIPDIIGALYTTRIDISAPEMRPMDY